MTRNTALLLLALALAAPASARAGGGFAAGLVQDGQNAINAGKKSGNVGEEIGGAVEKFFGNLFGGGGHHDDKPTDQHDDKHGDQTHNNGGDGGQSGDGNPTAPSSDAGGSTNGTASSTGKKPDGSPSTTPADSTNLVKKDPKKDDNSAGGAQQQNFVGSSSDGGLVGVHTAMGHQVFGSPEAAAASAASDAAAAPAAPQTVGTEGAATKSAPPKDTLLEKTVGQISGIDGSKGEIARQAGELLANAKNKMAMGDFQGAVDDLSRAISMDPTNSSAWTKRAEAYNQLKQYDRARSDALEAIKLDPNSSAAWEQLAYAEYKLGHLDDALKAADKAIALNPNNATAYWIRSLIKAKMGDMAGALRDLETAANLNSKFRDAYDRARNSGRVVDPDEESSLGDAALRMGLGLPFWVWALVALFALAGATVAGVLALRAPKARKPEPAQGGLARAIIADPAAEGRLAGKYEMRNLIGRGGMGNVYEAVDHSLGRSVAIKKMSEKLFDMAPQAKLMLIQEAKTVAALHHPAIVDIYEIIEDSGDLYLVFELVKGKTAQHLLAESGKLSLDKTVEILRPVCQALEFAHGRQLVHRDLKPANIMITEQGHVKLMDFGIARSLGDKAAAPAPAEAGVPFALPGSAQTQTVVGTPQYMAPETDQGVVSRQGDVYALGVCVYELTTGRLPFTSMPQKISLDFMKPSVWNPSLPPALDDLIMAALQPDPAKRLASAREFLVALEAAAKAATSSAPAA
jgi:tetratricopeptide (TPR) repeat protein